MKDSTAIHLRVLLVEDSSDDAQLIALQLEQGGLDVEYQRVDNEVDFIATLTSSPDLILFDYALPRFNIQQALSILKERGLDIPFIVVADAVDEDIIVEAIKRGAEDYVVKDRLARLSFVVRQALEQKRLRTESVHANQALSENEARLHAIIQISPDSIAFTDPQGNILMANQQCARMNGFDNPKDMIGMNILDLIVPEDRAGVIELSRILTDPNVSHTRELRLLRRDGSTLFGELRVSVVTDENGQPQGIIGDMRDITERKHREGFLALLNDMTRTILLSRDFDSTLQVLAANMKKLLDADDCFITRWNAAQNQTILAASTTQLDAAYFESIIPSNVTTMTESVLLAGRVITFENVINSPSLNPDIARNFLAGSILGVPLIVGENKLGAAIVVYNTPRHFNGEEAELAEQVGNQIALALWNFQQSLEIQQRLKQSNALAEIGRLLGATERVGIGEVLQLIVDSARELIQQAEESVIHILDASEQALVPKAISGFESGTKMQEPSRMRLGEGVAGQVMREGCTLNVGNINDSPYFLIKNPPPTFHSLLVVPLQIGKQRIGTISVQSGRLNAFSLQDEELLNALGIQAAIAIENTRLFENTQQRLKEMNALYKISQGLAASLNADELIEDVVTLLQKNFQYYHAQIYLLDPLTGDLVLRRGSGATGTQLLEQGFRLSYGVGIIGHVATTGEPFLTNNVNNTEFFLRNPLLPETQSELVVPIKVDERVVGALDIQQTSPHRLTEGDLQLITAVADQLSVVLQKASLYTNLQTALQQEQTVRSQLIQSERLALVGRLLASVSHELNNPLQAIQNALFLLKDETNLSNQAKQDLDVILSEAERMAALIERLRSAYRPIRIRDFQPMNLNDLIEDVHTLIATHMRHKEIVFEFHPDSNLPKFLGVSDQIRQVVLNLFLNAIEVMEPGGRLTVETRYLHQQNEVLLAVTDTGSGIDAEILPHIFDPFITSKHTGTGIGLTITQDIIQQHHGRIEAANNPTEGATFKVWLPVTNNGG